MFREAVDLYGATEGFEIWGAFERPVSVKEAIAGFLRASARAFSEPGDPRGCLIVLGALNVSETNVEVFRDLSERRMSSARDMAGRLKQAVAEGELPESADCDAIAAFYLAVQQGMSVQARDGASREALLAVADGAIAAWGALTAGAERGART